MMLFRTPHYRCVGYSMLPKIPTQMQLLTLKARLLKRYYSMMFLLVASPNRRGGEECTRCRTRSKAVVIRVGSPVDCYQHSRVEAVAEPASNAIAQAPVLATVVRVSEERDWMRPAPDRSVGRVRRCWTSGSDVRSRMVEDSTSNMPACRSEDDSPEDENAIGWPR